MVATRRRHVPSRLLMLTMLTGELTGGDDVKVASATPVTTRTFGLREPLKSCLRARSQRVQSAGELLTALPR